MAEHLPGNSQTSDRQRFFNALLTLSPHSDRERVRNSCPPGNSTEAWAAHTSVQMVECTAGRPVRHYARRLACDLVRDFAEFAECLPERPGSGPGSGDVCQNLSLHRSNCDVAGRLTDIPPLSVLNKRDGAVMAHRRSRCHALQQRAHMPSPIAYPLHSPSSLRRSTSCLISEICALCGRSKTASVLERT